MDKHALPRTIARAFGVSDAAVSQWIAVMRKHGPGAWRAKQHPSGPVKLTSEHMRLLPEFLSHGAEAYGFRGHLWTCARVAGVIWAEFGVSYHKAHVSRLLKALKWTPQLPVERAAQRDEARIEPWRMTQWPALKKKPTLKGSPLCVWMKQGFTCCLVWLEPMRRGAIPPSFGQCLPVITSR
jgi:transposase